MYVTPVIAIVGWMYYAGWRERRHHGPEPEPGERDAQWTPESRDVLEEDTQARPVSGQSVSGP
jgi:hypothetical protein